MLIMSSGQTVVQLFQDAYADCYGDLKARIDMVRNKTGKSLIVERTMEEPGIDYTVPGGAANGCRCPCW